MLKSLFKKRTSPICKNIIDLYAKEQNDSAYILLSNNQDHLTSTDCKAIVQSRRDNSAFDSAYILLTRLSAQMDSSDLTQLAKEGLETGCESHCRHVLDTYGEKLSKSELKSIQSAAENGYESFHAQAQRLLTPPKKRKQSAYTG